MSDLPGTSSSPERGLPANESAPGRRSAAGRRVGATGVLAVLVPALTVGALLLVDPYRPAGIAERPPESVGLNDARVVCPQAVRGAGDVLVTTAEDATGEAGGGLRGDQERIEVVPDRVVAVTAPGRFVVTARGRLAPGLVAARTGTAPLAAVDCPPPAAEQWFTAVGAGAPHDSVLELVNPNAGRAIADVTVLAGAGPLEVPELRGISVPGGQGVRIELGTVVPRRGELALRVATVRGRLAATVLDRYDEPGAGGRTVDWLPGQAEPQETSVLLGLPAGAGSRTLVVANPGDDEVRATVRLVTEESVLTPQGSEPFTVAPGNTVRTSIDELLGSPTAEGALGLQIESTGPVTAALRGLLDGDLVHATVGAAVTDRTAVVVPPGEKELLVGGVDGVGVMTVVSRAADGTELDRTRVELQPDSGRRVALPSRAELVTVSPERTGLVGAVLVTGRGAAVVPLRELVRSGLVPDVRPGLP